MMRVGALFGSLPEGWETSQESDVFWMLVESPIEEGPKHQRRHYLSGGVLPSRADYLPFALESRGKVCQQRELLL